MGKLINLIKEEVYDYLNNDKRVKENDILSVLNKDEIQKKFILDVIDGNNTVKSYSGDNDLNSMLRKYGDIKENFIDVEVTISFDYTYDSSKEPINFNIEFDGNKVSILDGELNNEEDINNINWLQFSVILKAKNGSNIDFKMFKNAPDKIKELFIKSCIKETLIKGLL